MSDPRIRHIPWCYPSGDGFGHHYITQDPAMPTAEQFDIAVFPRGDKGRIAPDPLRDTPHIRIRVRHDDAWQETSITAIGRAHSQES